MKKQVSGERKDDSGDRTEHDAFYDPAALLVASPVLLQIGAHIYLTPLSRGSFRRVGLVVGGRGLGRDVQSRFVIDGIRYIDHHIDAAAFG